MTPDELESYYQIVKSALEEALEEWSPTHVRYTEVLDALENIHEEAWKHVDMSNS